MDDVSNILSKSKKLVVLYVEDNETVRINTLELFKDFFLNVDEAIDGVDGLQQYQDYNNKTTKFYDIIITDINMPKLNGLDMIKKIKKINSDQVCVTISAYSDTEFLQKSIEIGVDSYIIKPINYQPFLRVLANMIEKIDTKLKLQEYQSKLKELLSEQTQLSKIAQEQSKQKSKFLASMSHEIRNPLTAILGYVDLLREMENDKQKSEYINVIDYSSKSLLGLVNDILDLSKIEENKLDIVYSDFDAYYELENISKLFVARADDKRVLLKTNISKNLPKVLNSDILRIKQIVSNLLSNAIKFTSTKINFNIEYVDNNLIIVVEDDGIGMSQEVQSRIFYEYEQASNTTSHTYGGTGLGLSITLKLTQLLKGDIALDSLEGEFSRFEVTIPVEIGNAKNILKTIDKDYSFNGHILLAEDNMINQKLVQRLLLNMNLTCDCANDGNEAYKMFTNEDYDLVLMDVNMPFMDGIEATKKIRLFENEHNITKVPVVSFSANARAEDITKYIDAGMDDYVAKPILKNKINEVFKKYLPYKEIANKANNNENEELNIDLLIKKLDFSKEEIIQMLNELLEQAKEQLNNIKDAYTKQDSVTIYKAAHFLKGSAYAMGINKLGEISHTIEQLGRANNINAIDNQISLLEETILELEKKLS